MDSLETSLLTAELLREGLLTKSADVFAFAVLMYEMYVGERCGLLACPVCRLSFALGSVWRVQLALGHTLIAARLHVCKLHAGRGQDCGNLSSYIKLVSPTSS